MPSHSRDQICEDCKAVVKNLARHKLTHRPFSKRNLYLCPWAGCDFSSLQKAGLKVHVNCKHTGDKPYVCRELNCGFATGDSSRLTRHRKGKHDYAPPERENRNRRAVKVEEVSDDGTLREIYIIVGSARAGASSTRKPSRRQPLVDKGQEELPISALPFSFRDVATPVYTPVAYDRPRVPAQDPMTVDYRYPASLTPQAEVPFMWASSTFKGFAAPYYNYGPNVNTCDAFYSSYPSRYSAVPRVFAGQSNAPGNQGPGSWSCPQAGGYGDYGYTETGVRVRGDAQWTEAFPGHVMDMPLESTVDDQVDSMSRCGLPSF